MTSHIPGWNGDPKSQSVRTGGSIIWPKLLSRLYCEVCILLLTAICQKISISLLQLTPGIPFALPIYEQLPSIRANSKLLMQELLAHESSYMISTQPASDPTAVTLSCFDFLHFYVVNFLMNRTLSFANCVILLFICFNFFLPS